jgi:hypothetical protein
MCPAATRPITAGGEVPDKVMRQKQKPAPAKAATGLPRFSWIYNAPASCRSNRRKAGNLPPKARVCQSWNGANAPDWRNFCCHEPIRVF